MKIHWFQHAAFEGLGEIRGILRAEAHELTVTRFHLGELPGEACARADALIVMGGPMGVGQTDKYPWLLDEKEAIARAINEEKRVLGICLGAQLIAECLGGSVRKHSEAEIGWWPIWHDRELAKALLPLIPPDGARVFHWHGDTYRLPKGVNRLASSEACTEQAFLWENRVLGWQFHLEMGSMELDAITEACGEELVAGAPYVQSEKELKEGLLANGAACRRALENALVHWLS